MVTKKSQSKKDSLPLERQFGVILEDINSKFDLVLDGHVALDVKIDKVEESLREDINKLDVKIDTLDTRLNNKIDTLDTRLNNKIDILDTRLNNKIDKVESSLREDINKLSAKIDDNIDMIGKVMVDVHIIKEDLEFVKNGLKRKIDVDEFAALERRVLLLEKGR